MKYLLAALMLLTMCGCKDTTIGHPYPPEPKSEPHTSQCGWDQNNIHCTPAETTQWSEWETIDGIRRQCKQLPEGRYCEPIPGQNIEPCSVKTTGEVWNVKPCQSTETMDIPVEDIVDNITTVVKNTKDSTETTYTYITHKGCPDKRRIKIGPDGYGKYWCHLPTQSSMTYSEHETLFPNMAETITDGHGNIITKDEGLFKPLIGKVIPIPDEAK